ncbi:MAG: hypothetical protein PHF21_02430 [Bacilli bacterium]|nr:hypothetical protein [Bacilli bacterium]
MNEGKGNTILLMIVGIATLLVAVIGATFAYFTAVLSGAETGETMRINSATIGTSYEGGEAILAHNMTHGPESKGEKKFTISATSSGSSDVLYDLGLVITTNTFSVGALKYTLTIDPSSSSGGVKAPEVTTQTSIPNSGTHSLGSGKFTAPTSGQEAHTYLLNIYFPDPGVEDNINQGKLLYAHLDINVRTSGEDQTTQP